MVECFRMGSIQIPSGYVHYRELGEGAPLLLLHANPGDSRDFDAVIAELAKHHRVIALEGGVLFLVEIAA